MWPSDDGAAGTRRLMETDGYGADLGVPGKVNGDAEGSEGGWLEVWFSFRLMISSFCFYPSQHTFIQNLNSSLLVRVKPSDDSTITDDGRAAEVCGAPPTGRLCSR